MLNNPAMLELSGNAIKLYIYMKDWAHGEKNLDYSISLAGKVMSKSAFVRARNELIEAGLIVYTNMYLAKDKRETGHYEFSPEWTTKVKTTPLRKMGA